MAQLTFSLRRKWRNHTGNQGVDPLRVLEPSTLEQLVEIVCEAERSQCTVRAVGSGHSWSDVALTRGFLLLPTGLARPLELQPEILRAGVASDGKPLVRVQGGMRIRELNAYLLADYEDALYGLGGRPHWGQYNTLTGSDGLLEAMYPRYRDWLAVHARLNLSGVFDSPFSKRVGISSSRFVR